jgi:hypothetical protein
VSAETPHERENALKRWPLDANAANKASFSDVLYRFAISLF